jgi:hypothetical protein
LHLVRGKEKEKEKLQIALSIYVDDFALNEYVLIFNFQDQHDQHISVDHSSSTHKY